MPAATHVEKEGTLHQHPAAGAVARQGARAAGRRALGAVVHAPPGQARARRTTRTRRRRATGRSRNLHWDYPEHGARREPDAEAVLKEINGYDVATGRPLSRLHRAARPTARPPAAAGSTRGVFADGVNQARRRDPGDLDDAGRLRLARVGLGVAGQPAHRSTTARPPTRRASRGRSARSTSGGTRSRRSWTGYDVPDFPADKRPDYRAPDDAQGHGRDRRRRPVHHDGRRPRAGCTRRAACSTARCRRTTSRSSRRSHNLLYPQIGAEPGGDPLAAAGEPGQRRSSDPRYPVVATTFRLTEHHTAGGMSRNAAVAGASCSPRCSPRSTRCSPRDARHRGRRLDDDRDRARARSRRARR